MSNDNRMTRDELLSIINTEREVGKIPDLMDVDLQGINLRDTDLHGIALWGNDLRDTDLRGANLAGSNLHGADLRHANLAGANLENTLLPYANLQCADLQGTNLHNAQLIFANLRYSNLQKADLRNADLAGANFSDTRWGGFHINGLINNRTVYHTTLAPTPDGWVLHVGSWQGTLGQLRDIITHNKEWPEEGAGDSLNYNRPYLESILALCETYMKNNTHYIEELKEEWND